MSSPHDEAASKNPQFHFSHNFAYTWALMAGSPENCSQNTPPNRWCAVCRRPLLALALATVGGCVVGFSAPINGVRQLPILDEFLRWITLLCLVASALWLAAQNQKSHARWPQLAAILACVFILFAVASARRLLAPIGDISQLVRGVPVADESQKPLAVSLQGRVAQPPRIGDFGTEFPLEVDAINGASTAIGRIWTKIPNRISIEEDDVLELDAELLDLPRAGNRGERESSARFIGEHCWCLARVRKSKNVRVVRRGERNFLARLVTAIRRRLPQRFENDFRRAARPFPRASAQLLAAMTFGEGSLQEPLPRPTRNAFRAAGLSHVLVASGTQVTFLALILLGAMRRLGMWRWSLFLVLPALLFYALIAGGSASIWRAAVGGACLALALVRGRDSDGISLWCLALVALLWLDPLQLRDIGFQLTFGATWGLIVVAPALRQKLVPIFGASSLIEFGTFSLSAQAATMPLSLYHFGQISLAGLGANIIAVPVAGMLVGTGLLGLIFAPVNTLNYQLTNWVQNTAYFSSRFSGASASALPLELKPLGAIYLALCLMLVSRDDWRNAALVVRDETRRWWRRRQSGWPRGRKFWFAIIAIVVFAGCYFFAPREKQLLVAVLDVGQGESIVIRAPSGRALLIDGGSSGGENRNDVGRAVIAPYLQSLGINHLDAMILTHADSDHCNGLSSVLNEVPVDMALDGAANVRGFHLAAQPDYWELREAWKKRGVRIVAPRAGQKIDLGDGVILTILAPIPPAFESDNENGIVARLDFGTTSFLFTGDIGEAGEERLLQSGADLRCTVLKVAHHGSNKSGTAEFLRAASPRIAVVSCARYNSFGHPAPKTLSNLAQRGASTFRTDRDGAVEITSDGRTCKVQTFR